MNANQILSAVSPIFRIAAMVIAAIAALKLFGFGVPVRGNVLELAAVAVALSLAK